MGQTFQCTESGICMNNDTSNRYSLDLVAHGVYFCGASEAKRHIVCHYNPYLFLASGVQDREIICNVCDFNIGGEVFEEASQAREVGKADVRSEEDSRDSQASESARQPGVGESS